MVANQDFFPMQNQVTPVKVDTVIYRCLKAMRDMMEERASGQSRKKTYRRLT